jgi:hypothetical protein
MAQPALLRARHILHAGQPELLEFPSGGDVAFVEEVAATAASGQAVPDELFLDQRVLQV